ncbi:hypothetical protein EOM89_01620 [Candidatus Falkowbacteria bacterium]|nr:hypothetical protein [Candidatus Falkowbacteria bacterium]
MQGDTERLTYAEAAARLGCLEKSVATRAKRRGWQREKGNDGLMRVHIPRDCLPDSIPDNRPDSRGDIGPTVRETELMGQINVLQAKLEAQAELVQRLEGDKAEAAQREAWLREQIEALQKKRRWWPW